MRGDFQLSSANVPLNEPLNVPFNADLNEIPTWRGLILQNTDGSGGIRTHASEETGALNQRLRPLGHATSLKSFETCFSEIGDEFAFSILHFFFWLSISTSIVNNSTLL